MLWAEKPCEYCGRPMFLNINRAAPTGMNRKCHDYCAHLFFRHRYKYNHQYPTHDLADVGAYMSYVQIGDELGITAQAVHAAEKRSIKKYIKTMEKDYKQIWNNFKKEFDETYDYDNEMVMVVYLLIIYFADEFKKSIDLASR
jgi:hypothetical protein